MNYSRPVDSFFSFCYRLVVKSSTLMKFDERWTGWSVMHVTLIKAIKESSSFATVVLSVMTSFRAITLPFFPQSNGFMYKVAVLQMSTNFRSLLFGFCASSVVPDQRELEQSRICVFGIFALNQRIISIQDRIISSVRRSVLEWFWGGNGQLG